MFDLLPWGWTHWVLLVVGPLFVVAYLSLLSWGPVGEVIKRLSDQPGPHSMAGSVGLLRAEALLGLVSLLLLTPLAGMVALFLIFFAMVILATIFGPLGRVLGVPDWAFMFTLGTVLSVVLYANSQVWLPWSLWMLDRLVSAYLIPFL